MRTTRTRRQASFRALAALSLALFAPRGLAGTAEVDQARALFNVGAQAYEKGDYEAALEAFEAAYRVAPRPGILFSTAQAHRREYAITHEERHLREAIRLYREYLSKVQIGERRGDAAQALIELEPLAASLGQNGDSRAPESAPPPSRTRIMVSSGADAATVALDGGEPRGSPLIADVSAGKHHIRVAANGYVPDERDVTAVEGGLVAIDVVLEERRARLRIVAPEDAEVSIDRRLVGRTPMAGPLEVFAGRRVLWIAKAGYEPVRVVVNVARGEERTIPVRLVPTTQRVAAYAAFGASALSVVAGGVFTAVAVSRDRAASDLYAERATRNLTPAELNDYDDARTGRDEWRTAAILAFGGAAAAALAGAALVALDRPRSPPAELDERTEWRAPARPVLEVSVGFPEIAPDAPGGMRGGRVHIRARF